MGRSLIILAIVLPAILVANRDVIALDKWVSGVSFTTRQGLSNNQVTCVAEDSCGLTWIGTYDGLNRFDGYNFRNYFSNPNNPGSLSVALIIKLVVDRHNILWVYGTRSTLFMYDRAGDRFIRYDEALKRMLGNGDILITTASDGTLWVFGRRGVACYHQGTDRFYPFFFPQDNNSFRFSEVSSFSIDIAGHYWIRATSGSNQGSFIEITFRNTDRGKPYPQVLECYGIEIPEQSRDLEGAHNNFSAAFKFYRSARGQVYAASNLGLFKLNPETERFEFCHQPARGEIFPNAPPLLWCEGGNKVFIRHAFTDHTEVVTADPGQLIENYSISGQQTLWISGISRSSAEGFGLATAFKTGGLFRVIPMTCREKKCAVFALLKDRTGRVFIGTRDHPWLTVAVDGHVTGRINLLDKTTHKTAGAPGALWLSSPETLWVGYSRDLLLRVNLNNQRVERINELWKFRSQTTGIHSFGKVVPDTTNSIRIAGGNSIFSLDTRTFQVSNRFSLKEGMSIYDVVFGNRNNFHIASKGNMLHVVDRKIVSTIEICRNQFTILSAVKGDGNEIWLALHGGGIASYNISSHETRIYTREDGLANNSVYEILRDGSGKLWLSTNKGISRFDPVTEEWWNFDERDGLPIEEFNGNASYQTSDGEMLFGGMGGVVLWYPDSIHRKQQSVSGKVMIHEIAVAGVDVFPDSAVYEKKLITLARGSSNVTFHFTCTDFLNSDRITFHYRLDGHDTGWVVTDHRQRLANYVNLSPGKYTFHVEASDPGGKWLRKAGLTIVIPPKYYQTWYFRILFLLAVLTAAGSLVFIYIYQIRLTERKKQEMIKLELLRSQLNPHFIFNALNPLNYMISGRDVKGANQYLSDFSRLLRLFLNNSRSEFIHIGQETETIEKYLQIEQARFGRIFVYNIRVADALVDHPCEIAPSMVQPFLENSILHGFIMKNPDNPGRLSVRFEPLHRHFIQCIIEDDGIGITAAMKQKEQYRKDHHSQGIQIIRERLALHCERSRIAYDIVTEEANPGNEEPGTRVIVPIPAICIHKTKST